MLRKIRRNMLRNYLKQQGVKHINKSTIVKDGQVYKVKSPMQRYWHRLQEMKG